MADTDRGCRERAKAAEPALLDRVKLSIMDCEAAGPISSSAARVVARATIETCCAYLDEFARDHAATIPKGKRVTPSADALTRWCRAYLGLAIQDMRDAAKAQHPASDRADRDHIAAPPPPLPQGER